MREPGEVFTKSLFNLLPALRLDYFPSLSCNWILPCELFSSVEYEKSMCHFWAKDFRNGCVYSSLSFFLLFGWKTQNDSRNQTKRSLNYWEEESSPLTNWNIEEVKNDLQLYLTYFTYIYIFGEGAVVAYSKKYNVIKLHGLIVQWK